jgi:hypothetical protein
VQPGSVRTALDALFQNQSDLALLLSLRHDFPSEWSKFLGGANFGATVRRDYFPYFVQRKAANRKAITVAGLEVYDGRDVSRHHSVGNTGTATTDLATGSYSFSSAASNVLTRTADAEPFLIVEYSL